MGVDPIRAADDPLTRVVGAQTHALFEQHARMIYGLCRALLRDPDDADDATQATFISAYRSLLGGSAVREPAAWLATIARNECAARARARMREPLPLLEADLGHAPGPESELDRKAFVAELQQAIAGLPEQQREAVVLRDLYGLRYAEVGAALGISVASVESLLFRARRSLRISLKPLAGGALVVPVAVREGLAQALPAFSTARVAGGGAATGAAGLGLLAKLVGGPAAMKSVAGIAVAIAASSLAVVGLERAAKQRPSHAEQATQSRTAGANDSRGGGDAAVASLVATPTGAVNAERTSDKLESSAPGYGRPDGHATEPRAGRPGAEGPDDTGLAAGHNEHEGAAGPRSGGSDNDGAPGRSGPSGDDRGKGGSAGSPGDGSDDHESHGDDREFEASHSGSSHQERGEDGDSFAGEDADEAQDPADAEDLEDHEDSAGSETDEHDPEEPDPDGPEHGGSGHSSDAESGDGGAQKPA